MTSSSHQHFKLYKPYGFLSQFVQEPRKNKKRLGELFDFPAGIMTIGRLDHDSEGLLLLTTHGMTSHHVRSQHYEKEYYVQLDGDIDDGAINALMAGVSITVKGETYLTQGCQARKLTQVPLLPPRGHKIRDERHGPTSWLSITLTEGKNRQVRKMTAAVGYPTLRLVRVRIGAIKIDDLSVGEVRPIRL
ncbi:pseudouridine synthase [Shewanella sp. NIFS-20-20]|uniref:pseudouridine synthase n=1 Tax=Shewanella sp. NIFS-20-20 TaxID=2853806 RepID=UPI001C46F272|nr:pseudouridine synthase [Shewanella sp. NIFS-20-20]MBV7315050.1 pseudouridine synthase [Shewanella sp. NIFS-20-20]